ncbi:uncharacterized protein LOC128261507 [Drosophila gunungcola]|uniref:Uncharacterized protein n=1 Tax=Drosophila gunungcola TaxID=103775 RepID=A0A9P9YZ87_9MUSC|nr:uncharacterized protein LOC128261507 [Drosophila gunungcola]KAI8045819.1 hypothetical protein M5D96_002008 [Drosophila gunungcola]
MESGEEQLQLELDRISEASHQFSSFDDLMALTTNSERLMARVNSSLDALNSALDRLEERTDYVLLEIRRIIGAGTRLQGPHDGCGDPDARA